MSAFSEKYSSRVRGEASRSHKGYTHKLRETLRGNHRMLILEHEKPIYPSTTETTAVMIFIEAYEKPVNLSRSLYLHPDTIQ